MLRDETKRCFLHGGLNQYFVLQIEDWGFFRIFLDRVSDQSPGNIYLFNQSQQ